MDLAWLLHMPSNRDNCIVARQQLSWLCWLTCPVPICQACCLLEGQCGAHVAPLLLLVSGAWVDFWQALLSVVEDHVTVWRERARVGVGQCGVHKTGDVHAQTTTPHTHTVEITHIRLWESLLCVCNGMASNLVKIKLHHSINFNMAKDIQCNIFISCKTIYVQATTYLTYLT